MKTAVSLVASAAFTLTTAKFTIFSRSHPPPDFRPALQTLALPSSLPSAPHPTSPPSYIPPPSLQKRASTYNTCAYVSGLANYPLYCEATAFCASNSVNSHVGCCPDLASSSCNLWTTCLASSERSLYTTDNGFTLWCGFSSYPHCLTHIYRDSSGTATALNGYTLLGCAVAAGTDSVYYNPFIFATATSTSSSRSTRAIVTAPTDIDVSSGTEASSSQGSTTTLIIVPTAQPKKEEPTPIAAIAGGAVGGVAVLALIGFGAWFLLKKRDDKGDVKNPNPNPGGPPPGGPFGVGGYGGAGPAAAQMSSQAQAGPPAGGYFAPQPEAAQMGMAAVGVGAGVVGGRREKLVKSRVGSGAYDQQSVGYHQQSGGGGGGLGIAMAAPPLERPPMGSPSPPLVGGYAGGGTSPTSPSYHRSVSPPTGASPDYGGGGGYFPPGQQDGYQNQQRQSQSTQGGYQPTDPYVSHQQHPSSQGGYPYEDQYPSPPSDAPIYTQDTASAPMYYLPQQAPAPAPVQRESHPLRLSPPGESYPGRPQERSYQAYQPPVSSEQAQGGGAGAGAVGPPAQYLPPQTQNAYQPYPTGGYRNGSGGYTAELPLERGDGEVRELPG